MADAAFWLDVGGGGAAAAVAGAAARAGAAIAAREAHATILDAVAYRRTSRREK
jgi:hypothetical protein